MVGLKGKGRVSWGLLALLGVGCNSQPLDAPASGDGHGSILTAAAREPASNGVPGRVPVSAFRPANDATRVRPSVDDELALAGGTRREIVSPPLRSRTVGENVLVDLRLPTLSTNAEWLGELQVFITDPSVEGGQRYVGGKSLTSLQPGLTSRIAVPIPAELKPLFAQDEKLKIVLQVPAGAAPYFVRQVSFDAVQVHNLTPTTATLHLRLPAGGALANTALSAATRLDVRDGVSLSGPLGLTLASGGSLELGADSLVTGRVRAIGDVYLRERAHVTGDVTSQTSFSHQNVWTIDGTLSAPSNLSPLLDQPLTVEFPRSTQPLNLEPDQVASASAGAFTTLNLKSRSKLTLAPGDYYFDSVQVETGAELRLSDPQKPVVLHVKDQLSFSGSMPNALPANVLWMDAGTQSVAIGSPLVGTLLAPNADVRLAPTNGATHRGAVFGKSVLVERVSPFQLVPFSGWEQLVHPRVESDAQPSVAFRARWIYPSGEPVQSFSYAPAPSQFRTLAAGQAGEVPTTSLSFEIENLTAAMGGITAAYSVVMKSWGLGNFYSDVPLQEASANVTLTPGSKKTIAVPNLPAILGVKASDMPAKGDIVVGLHRINGGVVEATPFARLRMPQFFYHFSDDLTKVFTYSLERASDLLAPSGMVPKDGVIERYAQGVFHANLFAPAGMLNGQTSEQARASLLAAFADRPAQLYGIRWDAQRPGETRHSVIPTGATPAPNAAPYNSADGPTGVCATWPTVFVDNGDEPFPVREQTEFKGIVDFLPAAFSFAQLYQADGSLITEGYLNANGCFAAPQQLGKGNYLLRVFTTDIRNNKVRFDVTRFEPPQVANTDKEVSVTYAVYVNAPGHTSTSGATSFRVTTGMWTETTHLAGFASHLLSRDAGGVDFGLTRGTDAAPRSYPILANVAKISAFSDGALNINAFLQENSWVSDARWKFVLAHEFGHMVQSFAGVTLPATYNFIGNASSTTRSDANDSASASAIPGCNCDVIEVGSNRLHCLQSIELSASAQQEAFGHLMATRVWNKAPSDPGYDGTCHFTYYKQVGATDIFPGSSPAAPSLPPVSIDCSKPVQHRKLACGGVNITSGGAPTEGASEVDWLLFFRALTTSTTTPVSVGDILSWYKASCGPNGCSSVNVTFAGLLLGVPAATQPFVSRIGHENGVD